MNTTIKAGLAAILLLAISCSKENITTSADSQYKYNSVTLADSFYIGQNYGGGIIFYIDSTGQHGLIADTADLAQCTWWNGVNTKTQARETVLGTGYRNTKKIVSSQGDSGRYAARKCWLHKVNGYSDWYLPSKDELHKLFKQKDVVGGFTTSAPLYWSSSEYSGSFAWVESFGDGHNVQNYVGKFSIYNVRAVRSF